MPLSLKKLFPLNTVPSAQVADPASVPTLATATTGGALSGGTYYVKYTWVTAVGESLPSPEASIVIPTGTTTNNITVTIPALPTGVTKANVYIATISNAETLQGNTVSTTYSQNTALASGAALPTASTSNTLYKCGTTNAIVKNVSFTNTTAIASTITLYLIPPGGSLGTSNTWLSSYNVPANGFTVFGMQDLAVVLNIGDMIQAVQGTANAINIKIDGVEVS